MATWRQITVNGKTYQWKCGKNSLRVKNFGYVRLSDLTGLTQNLIDRGRHKQTSDGMITPAHVEKYIKENTV